MDYLVMPKGDWRFSPQELRHHLRYRWPGVTLREIQNPELGECLEFELPMNHSQVTGAVDAQGRYVSFEGDIRDCAELALWLRALSPASEPLLFGDESLNASLDLESATTSGDLFRLYDYTPPPPGWSNYTLLDRSGWSISPHDFARALRLRWPGAQVEEHPEAGGPRSVEFRVPMAHSQIEGSLKRQMPAPVFTGEIHDCAEFALWCCSLAPSGDWLLSCDRGYLHLEPHSSVADIVRACTGNLGASPRTG
ncbi:hypothetical protein F0U61_16030 [Archangium violaceum]|uniref:hypothetical protein n=1 Tax=Archangium violaceum TaxID=83451 RepID=UPI002B27C459|nr:hypothetical protein F0U61_16030 [Archangium violaceum]